MKVENLLIIILVLCFGLWALKTFSPPPQGGDATTQVVAVKQTCLFAVCEQTANFDVVGDDVIEQAPPPTPAPTPTPAPPAPAPEDAGDPDPLWALFWAVVVAIGLVAAWQLWLHLFAYREPDR